MNYDDDLPIGCVFLAALLFMALFLWLNPVQMTVHDSCENLNSL
jgi:hypothetical protein